MTPPKVMRPSWRTNPFSEGGRVIAGIHHAGGVLLPEPNPLWNIDPKFPPDLEGLPWERRTYDAWTTLPFRDAVRAWLVAFLAADTWISAWQVREKATSPRMTLTQLTEPLLIVTVTRKADGRVFQAASSWTARERDDLALAVPKLDGMRGAIEADHALHPP